MGAFVSCSQISGGIVCSPADLIEIQALAGLEIFINMLFGLL